MNTAKSTAIDSIAHTARRVRDGVAYERSPRFMQGTG
jgi:hypothetical protein